MTNVLCTRFVLGSTVSDEPSARRRKSCRNWRHRMQLVEQHVIKQTDARYQAIDQVAFASKNLYNAANYVIRQAFIHEGSYLCSEEMHAHMKNHEAYQALPRKVSQQVLRLLHKNWMSFFKAIKAWKAD